MTSPVAFVNRWGAKTPQLNANSVVGRLAVAQDVLAEAGGVIVGDVPSFRVDQMPYGGVKDSGLGREGLRFSIEDMTEPRLMVMALK